MTANASRRLCFALALWLLAASPCLAQQAPTPGSDDEAATGHAMLSLDAGGHTAAIYDLAIDPGGYQLVSARTGNLAETAHGPTHRRKNKSR